MRSGLALLALAGMSLCGSLAAADNDDMVAVPAGTFTMGSADGPADERPSHIARTTDGKTRKRPVRAALGAADTTPLRTRSRRHSAAATSHATRLPVITTSGFAARAETEA